MKKFKLGLYHGRFQHIHLGHQNIIDLMRKECKSSILLVGSAQQHSTEQNPFNVQERLSLISLIYGRNPKNMIIEFFPDLNINPTMNLDWSFWIMGFCEWFTGNIPDVIYGGPDANFEIFKPFNLQNRKIDSEIQFRATNVRQALKEDDISTWKRMTDPKIWHKYITLRGIIKSIK